MNWTHERGVVLEDPHGLHCRNTALLCARLRKARKGTRVGLRTGGEILDWGEARKLRPSKVLESVVPAGVEVEALARGPDAETVLEVVAETFAERHALEFLGVAGALSEHFAVCVEVLEEVGDMGEADRIMGEAQRANVGKP